MADDHIVVLVGPVPGGWCVQADSCQPLMFRSGHEAEAHGRRLAGRLRNLGLDTCLEVRDRRGRLAGSTRFVPSDMEPAQ